MTKIQHKDISSKATGIEIKKTKISSDNRQGVVECIAIYPQTNAFVVSYRVERLDSIGNSFEDVSYNTKKAVFKDEASWGTVDFDDNGEPIWSTFVETTPEVLNVTNWYKVVGNPILSSAISFIELKENL